MFPHHQYPIVIYMIHGCPYCRKAMKMMRDKNIGFKPINVGNNGALATALTEETGWRTVPKVFINGNFVGGSAELEQLLNNR